MSLLTAPAVTMSSREIAELVESRHDKVKQSIERLAEKGVIQLPPMGEVKNHRGQMVSEYRLEKRDSYIVVAQLSPEFTARLVDRWQELEQQIQVQIPTTSNKIETVQAGILLLESATKLLNLSNSSRLGGLQQLQKFAGLPNLVPSYAIDAPVDANDGSSRPTAALRTLLKQHDVNISSQYAYKLLQEIDVVEKKTRPSRSKGSEKTFWCLTAYGLRYGKNITSPGNPRETQPHFFESRFPSLLALMKMK